MITPKVSVIINTYNCASYINQSLDSVFNQDYTNYEIIVVDDGSTDNTKSALAPFIDSQRIRYFFQSHAGLPVARNFSIKLSQGEYLTFLDADDYWAKGYLAKMVECLEKSDADWVICEMTKIFTSNNQILRQENIYNPNYLQTINNRFIDNKTLLHYALTKGALGIHLRSLIAKKCFYSSKIFYDESMRLLEDRDVEIRLIKSGINIIFLDEALCFYRREEGFKHNTKVYTTAYICQIQYNFYRKYLILYLDENLAKFLSTSFFNIFIILIKTRKLLIISIKSITWAAVSMIIGYINIFSRKKSYA